MTRLGLVRDVRDAFDFRCLAPLLPAFCHLHARKSPKELATMFEDQKFVVRHCVHW